MRENFDKFWWRRTQLYINTTSADLPKVKKMARIAAGLYYSCLAKMLRSFYEREIS